MRMYKNDGGKIYFALILTIFAPLVDTTPTVFIRESYLQLSHKIEARDLQKTVV
jgi:hypothetical protein